MYLNYSTDDISSNQISYIHKVNPIYLQNVFILNFYECSLFCRFKVLWGSWVIKGPYHSFYFAGDTAYCKAFKEIGQRYGPLDLAAIPVGATEPM